MQHELARIFQKPNDYKICKGCGALNWYENESCINCGSEKFKNDGEDVSKYVDDEYKYWMEVEGYSEEEADNVLVEV